MQRYFASIRNNFAYLSKEDEHHLLNVMRANKNEDIEIVFENKLYLGRINEIKPLSIKVVEEIKSEVELPNKIILIICLLKGEKLDLVVQKATELGVSEIVFVASKRAISKAKDFNFSHKCERYNKIAKEAAQQSHRLSVPVINRLIDFDELGEIIADEKMIAYEKEDGKTENLINIISNLSIGFNTGHFILYGEKFIARIQTEDPADPEIFNIFWDEFENHLKDAINDTAVAKDMATGAVPGGTFNGIASIRLLSDLGE